MRSFEEEIKELERSKKTGQIREIREIKEEVVDRPPVAQGPAELGIRFVGSGSEYFRIWIVNLLLTLVTLGFYYPFAKTRRLKYFYGATEVGGHPLSFHGRPWAMFRGYLVALAFFIAYSLAGYVSPIVGLAALVVVTLLWPVLWHSSLRFRMANTGWRGLRMSFTGRRGEAYKAFALSFVLLLSPVLLATVRLMMPGSYNPDAFANLVNQSYLYEALAKYALYLVIIALVPTSFWLYKRYQQNNLAVASEQAVFVVGLGKFYRLFCVSLFYCLFCIFAVFVAILGIGQALSALNLWAKGPFLIILTSVAYLAVLCVIGGYFTAQLQNLIWNGTRSSGLAFRSTLPAGALIKLWFQNWLLTLVTVGFYHPYAKVANARLRLESVTLLATVNVDELVAAQGANAATATGDAVGDLFGLDFGL
jgi:uncharacterized membrane protein YjgN (DUF898 family)